MHWHIKIPLRAASGIRNTNWSLAFVALAALCWGLSGGIAGILTGEGWDPVVVSFYRGGTGLLFVLIWLAIKPHHSGLANPRLWFWSVLAGVGVAGNFTFYFLSIAEGSVAVAATLMYCAPIFVYIVSFLFRLEKPTVPKCVAIVLVMAGVVLLTGVYDIEGSDVTLIAAGAGLLSGMSYALFIFGFKYAEPHGSPQAILAIAFAALTIILIGFSGARETLAVLTATRLPLFLVLGVLGAGLSFILYIKGLNYTAPALAAIVAMIEPVTASLFGVVFLNESLAALQLVGMVLILITVTGLGVYSSRE